MIGEYEQRAIDLFTDFVRENKDLLCHVARWGDGRCGHLSEIMANILVGEVELTAGSKSNRKKVKDKVKRDVMRRDNNQCLNCGKKEDLTLDHIIPISLGGCDSNENLQILCRSCNSKKSTSIIDLRK